MAVLLSMGCLIENQHNKADSNAVDTDALSAMQTMQMHNLQCNNISVSDSVSDSVVSSDKYEETNIPPKAPQGEKEAAGAAEGWDFF